MRLDDASREIETKAQAIRAVAATIASAPELHKNTLKVVRTNTVALVSDGNSDIRDIARRA